MKIPPRPAIFNTFYPSAPRTARPFRSQSTVDGSGVSTPDFPKNNDNPATLKELAGASLLPMSAQNVQRVFLFF